MNKPFVTNVFSCARCGLDHKEVHFLEFSGKPITDQDGVWNYWAICPETQDPILLRVMTEDLEESNGYIQTLFPESNLSLEYMKLLSQYIDEKIQAAFDKYSL